MGRFDRSGIQRRRGIQRNIEGYRGTESDTDEQRGIQRNSE